MNDSQSENTDNIDNEKRKLTQQRIRTSRKPSSVSLNQQHV